jgi:hypothetical protein
VSDAVRVTTGATAARTASAGADASAANKVRPSSALRSPRQVSHLRRSHRGLRPLQGAAVAPLPPRRHHREATAMTMAMTTAETTR